MRNPDNDANEKLYRKKLPAKDIVLHRAVLPPASAAQLLAVLNKKSPRNKSHVGLSCWRRNGAAEPWGARRVKKSYCPGA